MDRSIVLVDAGYLLGAAHSTASNRGLVGTAAIRYPELIAGLIAQAEERTGVPTLRVYWYSPWPETHSGADLRTLQQLPNVKVRLGAAQGEVNDQAGVSTPLQRDLITLARNHAVADAVLLSADENLTGAIEEAQTYGVRVHLWGVQAASGSHGQSHTMIASADCRVVISAAWVGQHVNVLPTDATSTDNLPAISSGTTTEPNGEIPRRAGTDSWDHLRLSSPGEPLAPNRTWNGSGDPLSSQPGSQDSASHSFDELGANPSLHQYPGLAPYSPPLGGHDSTANEGLPPLPLSGDSPHAVRGDELGFTGPISTDAEQAPEYDRLDAYLSGWSNTQPGYPEFNGAPDPAAPGSFDDAGYEAIPLRSDVIMRLAEITSDAQASVDQHQDSSARGLSVDEIGYRFGLRWASRTSADQLDALVGRYAPPSLPRKLATEIDEYATYMGVDGPESELIHHALALAFWAALVPAASERF